MREIREDLEGWLGATEAAALRPLDPGLLRERFPRAVSRDTWKAADDAVAAAEGLGDTRLLARHRALRALAARLWLADAEGGLAGEVRARAATARGRLPDGSSAPVADIEKLRTRIASRADRAAAEESVTEALAGAAEGVVELLRHRRELAQQAGARDVRDLVTRLEGRDLVALAASAQRFLAGTVDPYVDNLGWTLRRHGASLETVAAHDLAWVRQDLRGSIPAPAESMAGRLESMLRESGIDPSAHGRLRRIPAPGDRSFVVRRRVPGDVALALRPQEGLDGWADALSAWGRALFAAHTSEDLAFEDRLAGDRAVPAAWGDLLALPLCSTDWLMRTLQLPRPRDAARELAALDLARTRRIAALFLAELDLAAGASPDEASTRVAEATRMKESPVRVLLEVSPWLDVAHAVRARAAAHALDALLTARFDLWHRNPETGTLLVSAWSLGRSLALPELLATLGAAGDPFDASVRHYLVRLS